MAKTTPQPTGIATDEIRRLRETIAQLRRVNAELRAGNELHAALVGQLAHKVRQEQSKVAKQKQRAELWKARALRR